jgi:hypothetical protein
VRLRELRELVSGVAVIAAGVAVIAIGLAAFAVVSVFDPD